MGTGDLVVIYMPMVPEAMVTMLACARLGAPHSLIFGGFASKELSVRIDHAKVQARTAVCLCGSLAVCGLFMSVCSLFSVCCLSLSACLSVCIPVCLTVCILSLWLSVDSVCQSLVTLCMLVVRLSLGLYGFQSALSCVFPVSVSSGPLSIVSSVSVLIIHLTKVSDLCLFICRTDHILCPVA